LLLTAGSPSESKESNVDNQPKPSWEKLVEAGQKVVKQHHWVLGDLAQAVETHYGDDSLSKYAAEVDVNGATLRQYRWVARQWPKVTRVTDRSWTVHRILARYENRQELIKQVKTKSEALALAAGRDSDVKELPLPELPDYDGMPDNEPGEAERQSIRPQRQRAKPIDRLKDFPVRCPHCHTMLIIHGKTAIEASSREQPTEAEKLAETPRSGAEQIKLADAS
jgi:hypothetical protein